VNITTSPVSEKLADLSSDLTFITNEQGKHLSDRFGLLLGNNTRFFDCLVGYFFISGFHKLYPACSKTEKIRILIGIQTDRTTYGLIQSAREQQELALESHAHVRQQVPGEILNELQKSRDSSEIEDGVRKFVEWIKSGKLEVRAFPSERLHAKLYVMTFVDGHIDKGRVITGSSNLTESGLQDNLEFNVELKNRADYEFALAKFNGLWAKSVDVTKDYVTTIEFKSPYAQFTPYELYLKFLYEYFRGELNLPDEIDDMYLPTGFKKLKYQEEAVLNARKVLDAQAERLGQVANINQGVVSGCDYVSSRNVENLPISVETVYGDGIFVFDLDNSRDRTVVDGFSEKEKRLLRRFYKNSDIRRYVCSEKTTKRLLYIGRDLNSLKEYPRVFEHLSRFKSILSKRREVENGVIKFFQLQWPRTEDIFTGEKIVVPYRSKENAFAYNNGEWFCRSDCYVITTRNPNYALRFLLPLLNSRLYFQWLFHRGKRKGKMLEMFQVPLSELPVKQVDTSGQKQMIALSQRIVAAKQRDVDADVTALQRQIDQLVYALYDLTSKEIQIVEGFVV